MQIHRSELYHMRGSGVGAIFSSIFRHLIPIASSLFGMGKKVLQTKTGEKVLQAVKNPAMQAGLDIAKDALGGENLVKSIKKRGKEASAAALKGVLSGGGKRGGGCGTKAAAKRGRGSAKAARGSGPPPAKKKKKKAVTAKSIMSELGL